MSIYPKVTILVATYNQQAVILETLDSIARQSYGNIEVIISDDKSSDETPRILKEFVSGRENFKLHLQKLNLGITQNYNFLADLATGDYVAIFSGDDIMCADKIESQVKLLEANPESSFSHHAVYDLDANSNKVRGIISHKYLNNTTTIHDVLRNLGIPGSMSVMYRKKMVKSPVFCPNIRTASDWYQIISLCAAGDGLYIDKPLCYYRRDGNYNNKDTSKYEDDFVRTIEMARTNFSVHSDAVNKSCDYAFARYSLGAGYRCLIRGDRIRSRDYFLSYMPGIRYKLFSFFLLFLSYFPLRTSLIFRIKNGYKRLTFL